MIDFRSLIILVMRDAMVDRYSPGDCNRMSPESPASALMSLVSLTN